MTHSKCLCFSKTESVEHTFRGAEGAFWVLSVLIGNKVVWRLLHLYHSFFSFFFLRSLKITYMCKEKSTLSYDLQGTSTMSQDDPSTLHTTCWFVTNHRCIVWTARTIRRFNLAGQDQQFLKLILHTEHRLNLAWGNFGGMNENSLSPVPISVLALRLGRLKSLRLR